MAAQPILRIPDRVTACVPSGERQVSLAFRTLAEPIHSGRMRSGMILVDNRDRLRQIHNRHALTVVSLINQPVIPSSAPNRKRRNLAPHARAKDKIIYRRVIVQMTLSLGAGPELGFPAVFKEQRFLYSQRPSSTDKQKALALGEDPLNGGEKVAH